MQLVMCYKYKLFHIHYSHDIQNIASTFYLVVVITLLGMNVMTKGITFYSLTYKI